MATSPLWEETKNTDISPSCLQNLWPIFQSKSSADSCTSVTAFNPFTAFVLEILWNNSCEVELGDQIWVIKSELFSEEGQPALMLHWYGNRPAAPMILQKFLSTWWMSGQDEKRNTHISPSCLEILWASKLSDESTLHWRPFTAFAFLLGLL